VGVYPEDLKEVITAGEQLRIDASVRRFFARIEDVSLDNQYGPSETHVITAQLLEGNPAAWPDLPSIGTPLKNCMALVLDESMKPVETGAVGELYLGGRNLAHGYLDREDIEAKVFITNPFEFPGYPFLYKTGDLAALNEDGSIRFMGRLDHQIKIRGYRVEPGEINNAASAFPALGQCLTHAAPREDGVLQLVTYYTVSKGAVIDKKVLRRHLESRLPEYMVTTFLIEIDAIPYTPSGKVDIKALPKPEFDYSSYSENELLYESETEVTLAGIWIRLLGLERIPRTADFFELGGDSLRAVTLFLNIQEYFGRELPLSTLAHSSTIAQLARLIDGAADTPDMTGFRCLQLLRPGMAGEVPLFLIHGGKGNVLAYNDFSKKLAPTHPVYAFQWSGWDGGRGERSIPEMAKAYTAEIRRFNGDRPCRLGGNCVGGLIAIEVARLLAEEGVEVREPLLVWDAPNLHSGCYRKREPWGSGKQQAALERVKEGLLQRVPAAYRTEIVARPESCSSGIIGLLQRLPYLRRLVQQSKALLRIMPAYRARLSGQRVPMDVREHYCIRVMLAAVRRHIAKPYKGDMLYFRSCSILGRDFGIPGWWDDLYLGFEELCAGHFEAHVVGGAHNKVIDAAEVAEMVNQYLK
jgi:thioesterase domain-containing protein/acyl carrier protein